MGWWKKTCLVKLVRRRHDGFLHEALCSWRDETRDAATLEMVERVVTRNARRKLLQTTLRAWSEGARRRRRFAATFWRAARAVRSLEKRQQHGAFLAWRVAAVNETRRAADISGACARLRAVRKRPGRLQLASAFSIWARLSAASSHSDRHAEIAACTKRQRAVRTCFSTLRSNASLRRRARRALFSLDRRCSLRQLARGWGAMLRAAATASAERRSGLRLSRAEAAVAAGRLATRTRAHRTARRLLGVARGRAALEAFVAWRGLVREGRGARLGAAALAGRSRRRRLHEVFGSWRGEALASSRLRSRALSRISQAAQSLVSEAFSTWREGSRQAHGKAKALTALARASDRRQSDRAEMRLALRTWRRNACGGDGDGGGGRGGDGEPRGGGMADGLEAMAGAFVEAAAAFSTASSIPEVFTLVEDFVSEVAVSSRGRLLLLNGEPGGGMFCLESDRRAPPDQDPLEASFPIGNGLVARCVATGLAFQTRRGGNGSTGGASPPRSSRRLYSTSGALDVALAGPADLHALPPQERGYGFVSKSPPPGGGGRWWSESESPSPRRRRRQRQRSPSPAWREQQHRGDEGHRPPDKGFSGREMAALAVVAGQAAAALRRVGAAASEREEVLEELDAAAADRVDETQKREEAVKEEMKHLREAMEHVSGSAKGLARQRDEARAALARAKGTLRRMVPALREARDRQLGFRHYHDLIVNMSKNVLQDGDGANPEADDERGRKGGVAPTPCHADRGGGGNGIHRCCRDASVGSHTRHNNNGSIGEDMGTRGNSPGATSTIAIFGSEGGGVSGIPGRQGPRLAAGGGSAPLSECGFKVSPSSPRDKAAAAVSFARSGDDGGGDRFGPEILTVLRETAAAGGGSRVGVGAGTLMRDRGRSRGRQQRT
ncbi:hypothetical protein Esi_0002_0075 [Ectocarpus siliculosus]|uniref:Uncharacterized protein n=1 Tax=Ectocarpus siliculosus TaxID=2880 RepID=D7FQ01_ECTSI|nr:hypothetical protein Esi_0002_0075 [Ectocarpus siliculosus]|eukprot:CBJ48333.1 hypothetical protein Esi_0002_0075 [Ectocarpus siliculosus]